MRKYGGSVIHQQLSSDGILEIVQANGVRSMHFGTSSRQSAFLVADPERLHLSYVRAMSLGLVFCPQAQNVLMVGLGGGSLTQFLLNYYVSCTMTVIEKRRDVANASYQYFNLSRDDRMKLLIGDGGVFIEQQATSNTTTFDLLVIDAFDHSVMAESVRGYDFFSNCREIMTTKGIMIINLWGRVCAAFQENADNLLQAFDQRVCFLPVEGRANVIAFCFASHYPKLVHKTALKQAQFLERSYNIEMPLFLKSWVKNNSKFIPFLLCKR
ncbi:MAG: spermine synthase [Methylococcales bacterium]|jgi:spermidine synthase|nr:spermine synthase [Methylococcales bacterium]